MKLQGTLIILSLVLLYISCDKNDNSDPVTLDILPPTEISETGFQLNWTVGGNIFESIKIDLGTDDKLKEIIETIQITDVNQTSLRINNKTGAKKYYYRISLMRDGAEMVESEIFGVETSFIMQGLSLVTSDGKTLAGTLGYLESNSGSRPGIIMMHELGVWVNPWIDSPLMKALISEGYVCLTYYFRGHGSSSAADGGFQSLIDDKSLIAKDLDAAITFMDESEKITPGQLGLVGASLGGIMALAGNGYDQVQTSVSLSAPTDGVYVIFPDMTIKSAYYLVGELDRNQAMNVDFAKDAELLFKASDHPKKLTLILGTSDHGTSLLTRDSLNTSIKDWILQTLPFN